MYTVVENHQDFLLIDKNPDVDFHKGAGIAGLPAIVRKQEKITDLYPVHRLDKMTSGLLLFAKNKESARILSEQFARGEVEKYYLAVSDRRPKKKQGLVKGDMARSRRGSWKLLRSKESPAITRFLSMALTEGFRLYLLKPQTGKTHQLRVALKSIGAPAFGDPIYHPGEYKKKKPDRGYLHAYSLSFTLKDNGYHYLSLPTSGEHFLSQNFTDLVEKLKKPWDLLPG